jgi:hypothetical protein
VTSPLTTMTKKLAKTTWCLITPSIPGRNG